MKENSVNQNTQTSQNKQLLDIKGQSKSIMSEQIKLKYQNLHNFVLHYNSDQVKKLIEQKRYKQAFKIANKAAQLQHYPAYGDLARIYLIGDPNNVVKRDLDYAFQLAQQGANHNHANAQNILGICYRYSDDTEENSLKALEWIRKAAQQGYADGQYNLGECYENGEGIQKNYQKARQWYTKAADQGEPFSQNQLGQFYINGWGVEKNLTKAVQWFTKAAESGHTWAQYNLAQHYKNGDGVQQNSSKAIQWYTKAAKQGHTSALNELKQLIPGQIKTAQKQTKKSHVHQHGAHCKH